MRVEVQPFLKWAGGKRWLSKALTPYLELGRGRYIEPFLGSGAVFFYHQPAKAVLSDANAELIDCYLAIKDNPEGVEGELAKLSARPPSDHYYAIRSEKPRATEAAAARLIYLNRTCWNGLYRVNLAGEFNVPKGTKDAIILPSDNFKAISKLLLQADVRSCDFADPINQASKGDVIFADPPYTVAHNNNGFVKYNKDIFSWSDLIRLAECLSSAAERGALVVATNADHSEVRNLYDGAFSTRAISRASVIAADSSNRRKTTELFITNLKVGHE